MVSSVSASSDVPHVEISARRRWAVTAGVMTGMFLAALEATVIATAMPTVIASLGGMRHYTWVFSSYLLASTVTVPVWGKLSDLYGRRTLYQIAVAVFLAGSILSGVATSMTQLVLFRALQGIGAGGLVPLGMTIIGEIFTLRERARMQGLFSGVWGVASIVGPLIGGFLTDQLSWRWVFFINIPFGLASAVIMGIALGPHSRTRPVKIDYAGALTLTVGVTILLLAVVGGDAGGRNATATAAMVVLSCMLLGLFIRIERTAVEPIVPLQLFRNRVVSVAVIAGFLSGSGMFTAITFVPLFAQGARGVSATEAGSMLTPLMLAWVAMSIIGGRLLLRVGSRTMVLVGLTLLTVSFLIFSMFDRATPRGFLVADLVLTGAGLGLTMLTLLLAVQHSVPREQLGISTSLNQFSRTIGGAVGVAVMGAVLSAGLGSQLREAADRGGPISRQQATSLAANPNALIDPAAQRQIPPARLELLRTALADSLKTVFLLSAVITAVAFLAALRLPRHERSPAAPSRQDQEIGEDMLMAEMTVLDEDNEPVLQK